MKKQILNLGKALNKAEQSEINGGYIYTCQQFCSASPSMQQMQIDRYGTEPFEGCPCYMPC